MTTPTITLATIPAEPSATIYYSFDLAPVHWNTYASPVHAPVGANVLLFFSARGDEGSATAVPSAVPLLFDPMTPFAPSSVTAVATDPKTAQLSWQPAGETPSGSDGFEVYRDGVLIDRVQGAAYTAAGLQPMTTYSFAIRAVNRAGTRSAASSETTVSTPPTALPPAPWPVYATAPAGEYVNVDWTPAPKSVGTPMYRIWRSDDGATYSEIAMVAAADAGSYVDRHVYSSTRYYYAVSMIDSRGEGPLSSTSEDHWGWTAPYTGRPAAPARLSALEGSGSVVLSWALSTNPAVTGYEVTRADRSLGSPTTLTPAPFASASYVDTSVVNGEPYWYTVYSVDASGAISRPSAELRAQPRSARLTPTAHVIKKDLSSTACMSCHANHSAQTSPDQGGAWVGGGPNVVLTCLMCHSANSGLASTDVSTELGDPLVRSAIKMWTPVSSGNPMTCMDCHRALSGETSPTVGLLSAGGRGMSGLGGVSKGDAMCYVCHGAGSTLNYGDLTAFEDSAHVSVGDPPSGSQVKCMICHEDHASRNTHMTQYEGYMVCMKCHASRQDSREAPDTVTVWEQLTSNADANSHHPVLPADQASGAQLACQNCHNTHGATEARPLVDPRDLSPLGAWRDGSPGNVGAHCLSCHDGRALPASAETRPQAEAVLGRGGATSLGNIQDAYRANVHGTGSPSDTETVAAHLRSDMGYEPGVALDCSVCHDPHGSANNFALRTDVVSASQDATLSGVTVYKIPAGSIYATSPVGYDMRFFCSTCHVFDPTTHDPLAGEGVDTRVLGATDCTSCHRHTMPDGTASTGL